MTTEEADIERARLKQILPAYMEDYKQLCEKYSARLVPIIVPKGIGKFELGQSLDVYRPVTKDAILDRVAEQLKTEPDDSTTPQK
jgi:hypothetical protein